MDEQQAFLRNLQYGFCDDGRSVYSNLPQFLLEKRIEELERLADPLKDEPLLKPDKNLVIVDSNVNHLEHILNLLLPEFMADAEHTLEQTRMYSHHTQPYFVNIYKKGGHSRIAMVRSRTKGRDSITEKLTRKFAKDEFMGFSEECDLPFRISIGDVYSFTVVCEDEESCFQLEKKFQDDPHLRTYRRCDYITNPKEDSGYRSLHNYYVWLGNTIPTGTLFEAHFETIQDFEENNSDDINNPRSHRYYGKDKLKRKHLQGNNQIILLEKNGHDSGVLIPNSIVNRFVHYYLITY